MRIRKNLKRDFRIFIFLSKNIKFIAIVPIVVTLVLLPILFMLTLKQYQNSWYVNEQFVIWTQLLLPVISVWCILFSFIDLIENEGNELHYVNHRMKDNIIWIWFALHMLLTGVLCVLMSSWVSNVFLEYVRLLISSLFYTMLSYLLMYATNSMTITFLGTICYWLMSTFGNSIPIVVFNCYDTRFMTFELLSGKYIYIFIISVVMYLVAYWLNKRKEKFL